MKYSRIVILIPRDKLWRFVDAERMDEFLELIFIKETNERIFEGRIQFIVFMANRAIFTGTDATFSFDAATRPDCPSSTCNHEVPSCPDSVK